MYINMQFEVLYTISYQVIQKHIARYIFYYIQRKKDKKKEKIGIRRKLIIITRTRTGLKQREEK